MRKIEMNIIWKTIVGIGVVIAVISGIIGLQNKFVTCEKFDAAYADSIDIMRQMQNQQDYRDYDFAIDSLSRDIEIECPEITSQNENKCQKYERDREEFKKRRDTIRDSWKVGE